MADLASVLRAELDRLAPSVSYGAGTVIAVQTGAGTLTLNWANGVTEGVPFIASYTPIVGDKVHFLIVRTAGLLVLGATRSTASAPSVPTTRVAYIDPTGSASWYQGVTDANDYGIVVGTVRQGSSILQTYAGYYTYAAGTVAVASAETVARAELLLARVDAGTGTVAASLHEYSDYLPTGKPAVSAPEREYTGPDMRPGARQWVLIPVAWAVDILAGSCIGLAFQPNGALAAATYAEYAASTTSIDTETGSVAGRIRLTIAQ